jgi:hypothetical protein
MKLEETKQEGLICKQCESYIEIQNVKIIWDEKGSGYSTKLCQCPNCKTLNVIKYYEDCSLDLNKDTRYF